MADYEKMSVSEVQRLAKLGDKEALFEMAWRIELIPAKDRDNPVECCAWQDYWCEKAANAGNNEAKSRYARSLIDRIMNEDDRQKAMRYFMELADDFDANRLSAEQREDGVIAKLWLGIMLCEGYHTPRDPVKGTKLIKEADTFFHGFEGFGYKPMYKIGEVYATGLAQVGEEPTIGDLEQAIKYLTIAIQRFNPEKIKPERLEHAKRLLENCKQWKKTKESLHKDMEDIQSAIEGRPVKLPESTTFSGAKERREKMMENSPAAIQRLEADKTAKVRLSQRLAREGWPIGYFIFNGKEELGPFDFDQLAQYQRNGQLTRDMYVWKEGMEQWELAGDCPELSVFFGIIEKPAVKRKTDERKTTQSVWEEMVSTKSTGEGEITKSISVEQITVTSKPTGDEKSTVSAKPATQKNGRKKNLPKIIVGLIIAILIAGGAVYYFLFMKTGEVVDYSLIPVCNDGERWGYINRKGEYVINPQFEDADFFSNDGLAKIKSGGKKTGYINKKGEYVIPASYKGGTAFGDGLAFVVADGGLPTCIDYKGDTKFVLNIAKYVSSFSDGLAIFITEEGEFGFIDKNGNVVINAQFEQALPFNGGFARIRQKGDVGFIDKTGKYVINPQFKAVGDFSEGKAAFSNGKQWGYINTEGAYIVNPQYDDAGKFSKGLAAIKQGKSYGYINNEGRLIINPQFDQASSFSDGLAAVRTGDKYGYINVDGKYEINTQFEYAGDFYGGIALVRAADKWGFINKKGQYVVNPQFKHVKYEASIDMRTDFAESDYYDTSEFIKLFFDRETGNSFDGLKATTTLEELSEHPKYGDGVNARGDHYADYRQTIPVTKDISISNIVFHFINTPIYKEVEKVNSWGSRTTSRELDLKAMPDAIAYQFSFSGKANEKRSVVVSALKTEIERRHGQAMRVAEKQNIYCLLQGNGRLNFALDVTDATLMVAFNEGFILNNIK